VAEEKYVAKTMSGLEDVLAAELSMLGGQKVEKLFRAVSFYADLETLYKVNLWSRTALRVLKPFLQFKAHNETVFYKRLLRYNWTDLIKLNQTFKINSAVHSDRFNHSHYISLKTKDAIVDQFRDRYDGERPSIDIDSPDISLDVHCNGIDFTISLDSSGESLHKRGYRQSQRKAPLNEVLAAGMVLLSGWDGTKPLLDPMCGSGTILTEALLVAKKIPPRYNRARFAFMNWADYDASLWSRIKDEADSLKTSCDVPILGYDEDEAQIYETKALFRDMDISDEIDVSVVDFFDSQRPSDSGVIIMNPPYGLRLEKEDMDAFYKQIGDTFKKQYQGWQAWVISANKDAIKRLGLRTSKKMTLHNGSYECKYHRYDMYLGSRKTK